MSKLSYRIRGHRAGTDIEGSPSRNLKRATLDKAPKLAIEFRAPWLPNHPSTWTKRMMRAAVVMALCCSVSCGTPPEDSQRSAANPADQVIADCAKALGGADLLEDLRTFRMTASWDGGDPVVTEVQRPNLFKTLGRATLVFDGERAARLVGPEEGGTEGGVELLEADVWKDFEIDLAFNFPAFFDFPAEYLGLDSLDGEPVHKLLVTLPLGTNITYFLDANTHLPLVARTEVTIDGTDYTPERVYLEFREIEGILFPSRFEQGWTPETSQTGVLESGEVNVGFPEDHFQISPQVPTGG